MLIVNCIKSICENNKQTSKNKSFENFQFSYDNIECESLTLSLSPVMYKKKEKRGLGGGGEAVAEEVAVVIYQFSIWSPIRKIALKNNYGCDVSIQTKIFKGVGPGHPQVSINYH